MDFEHHPSVFPCGVILVSGLCRCLLIGCVWELGYCQGVVCGMEAGKNCGRGIVHARTGVGQEQPWLVGGNAQWTIPGRVQKTCGCGTGGQGFLGNMVVGIWAWWHFSHLSDFVAPWFWVGQVYQDPQDEIPEGNKAAEGVYEQGETCLGAQQDVAELG